MEMKMANEKRLTMDDPVGKDVLEKLAELETAEIDAALQLTEVMQEEIKLLAVSRRVKDERNKLFEKILMDRGITPNARAVIDQNTGRISLVKPGVPGQPPQPVQAAAPPPAAPPPPNGQG